MTFTYFCTCVVVIVAVFIFSGLTGWFMSWIGDEPEFMPFWGWLWCGIGFGVCATYIMFTKGVI